MSEDQIPVKKIVNTIEEYYSGKQIDQICEEHDVEQDVFETWLNEYKYIAIEIIELKLENEKLRKMFVELSIKYQALSRDSKK